MEENHGKKLFKPELEKINADYMKQPLFFRRMQRFKI
jgi:hypothetical protein